jgi:Protein of unknown function (DUF1553)/Protein of unknown function (DUF1549)/Planctomycete cytochrome C
MTFERLITILALACGLSLAQDGLADDTPPIFESSVQPILQQKCEKCHSHIVRKGGLDLSTMASLRRGGESGDDPISDTVDDSLLWSMIDGGGMPPEDEPQLSSAEIALIRAWIAVGAHSNTPADPLSKQITQHNVLPVVLLRCTACHGARLREGGLDLRTPAGMHKGGDHGPALIPGDADASRMIQRIESEACPPRKSLLKFFVKRPPAAEVEMLRDWINAGAPVVDVPPDVATTEPDPLVTDDDRRHWSFQPPRANTDHTSVDEFVLQKLHEHGLKFSPVASQDTLIRRAYLDLIGLPPGPEDLNRWRNSDQDQWYPNMIEYLLASPHYGERWARYWLDVAGYADSEGGVSADPVREVAWKYRDYVISAFNNDTPYDQFLMEQIAGDELIDSADASVVTDQMVNNLVATGFLRMGIDQTGSRTMNYVPERLGVIGDAISVLGSGVMGLTIECARCHSHKYDPIPHRDYYRFKAIFQGALDEYDWLTFKNRSLNVATPDRLSRVKSVNPPLQKQLKSLESRLQKAVNDLRLVILRQHHPTLSLTERNATLVALKKADNQRTQTQRVLVEKLQQAEIIPDDQQPSAVLDGRAAVAALQQDIQQLRRRMEPPLTIRALWDRGDPSPTYILLRGDHDRPGRPVGPGVPSVLTNGRTPFEITPPFVGGSRKTGRRLALARWLVSPDHPLTARVMVNRIWYNHFGTGLVRTLENFGVMGDRPSHPELLDWLARSFISDGYSIKSMHRRIMNSRTYRQSSRITDELNHADPQNRLLSRMSLRRMDAEAVRDSLLFVCGRLDPTAGGPPDPVTVDRDGLVSGNAYSEYGWRRSVYLQYRRTEIPTMMDTFDYPEMGPNCIARSVSTVSPQSLLLMNNAHIRALASDFAVRVRSSLPERAAQTPGALVDTVYQLALGRKPSPAERAISIKTLQELESVLADAPNGALESLCHTILNSAAFLYID